jgi:hypothetical protein
MLLAITTIALIGSVPIFLPIQIAEAQASTQQILKAGVKAYNSAAEFGPITIGEASTTRSGGSTVIRVLPIDVLNYNDRNMFATSGSELVMSGMNVTLKGQSILSNTIQQNNITYIDDTFRTLNISNPKDNHNGILWSDGSKEYYAFLRPDHLVVFTPDKGEIASAPAVHNVGKWDTIKVVYRGGLIDVFLNNAHKIQIKQSPVTATNAASNQGLRCYSGLFFNQSCEGNR